MRSAANFEALTIKTEAGAAVSVFIGSKNYPAKAMDSHGMYKAAIPKQTAGTQIKVTAMDKAKNTTTKTVKVTAADKEGNGSEPTNPNPSIVE